MCSEFIYQNREGKKIGKYVFNENELSFFDISW